MRGEQYCIIPIKYFHALTGPTIIGIDIPPVHIGPIPKYTIRTLLPVK
jgi:hypothetical protein